MGWADDAAELTTIPSINQAPAVAAAVIARRLSRIVNADGRLLTIEEKLGGRTAAARMKMRIANGIEAIAPGLKFRGDGALHASGSNPCAERNEQREPPPG